MQPRLGYGALAQLVEQWTENPCVPGSIPGGTTIKTLLLQGFLVYILLYMHYLYISYSLSIDKYYVGETPNLENRIQQHNSHYFTKGFTKAASDWEFVLINERSSKQDAIFLEKFIKKMKSKKFIRKVIAKPEILDEILLENK